MTSGTRRPQYYIASAFTRKEEMRYIRSTMQAAGFNVVADWLDEPAESDDTAPTDEYREACALLDLKNVNECDVFVCFIGGVGSGHHTELGLALCGGKRIVLIGKKNNIFHYLPLLDYFTDFADFLNVEMLHDNDGV